MSLHRKIIHDMFIHDIFHMVHGYGVTATLKVGTKGVHNVMPSHCPGSSGIKSLYIFPWHFSYICPVSSYIYMSFRFGLCVYGWLPHDNQTLLGVAAYSNWASSTAVPNAFLTLLLAGTSGRMIVVEVSFLALLVRTYFISFLTFATTCQTYWVGDIPSSTDSGGSPEGHRPFFLKKLNLIPIYKMCGEHPHIRYL